MSWCNPLNTTQPWPGAVDMNSVGVKRYLTILDGVNATVTTLVNGHYPVILSKLKRSIPRAQWTDACPNLGTWGTGCGWLNQNYGPPPGNIQGEEDDMTPQQSDNLTVLQWRFAWFLGTPVDPNQTAKLSDGSLLVKHAIPGAPTLPQLLAAIQAIPAGGSPDLTTLKADMAGIKADVGQLMGLLPGR